MTFFSAFEDFVSETLAALATSVGRLRYLANLRHQGRYRHWGMERVYGADAAQQAMGRAHTAVALEILRLPVREVMRQVRLEAERESVAAGEYVEQLLTQAEALQPQKLGGGSARHFTATLKTLSKLGKKAEGATRPAA